LRRLQHAGHRRAQGRALCAVPAIRRVQRLKSFFLSLLSGDESEVDSVIVCGVVALLSLIGTTIFVTIHEPTSFSPINFATAASGVIGSVAAGKTARDRWSTREAGAPPQQ
jgi:hypothetical protein